MFFRNICVQKNPSKHIPYYKGNASKSYNPYLLNIFDILVYLYHIHHLLSSTFYHNFIYNDSGVKSPGCGACHQASPDTPLGHIHKSQWHEHFLCNMPSALRSQGFWHPNLYNATLSTGQECAKTAHSVGKCAAWKAKIHLRSKFCMDFCLLPERSKQWLQFRQHHIPQLSGKGKSACILFLDSN